MQIGVVTEGFLLGMWERGAGRRSSPAVSGTALFKAQVFYISTVETVKEFWHLSFNLQPYVDKLLAFIVP